MNTLNTILMNLPLDSIDELQHIEENFFIASYRMLSKLNRYHITISKNVKKLRVDYTTIYSTDLTKINSPKRIKATINGLFLSCRSGTEETCTGSGQAVPRDAVIASRMNGSITASYDTPSPYLEKQPS